MMKLAEVVSLFAGPDAADVEFTAYDPAGRLPDMWTKTVGRG